MTRRMVRWGAVSGVVTGAAARRGQPVCSAGCSPATTRCSDLLVPVLLVAALGQPVAGVVFVLDGVLIGAGDGRYLARAGLVTLVVYAPVALLLAAYSAGLVAIWVAFCTVFMGARLVVLVRRARGDAWLVTGRASDRRRARPTDAARGRPSRRRNGP